MSPAEAQSWVALVGGLLAALLGLFRYFNYRSKRDRRAAVGGAFIATVEALSSKNPTQQMAAAVLLRRFFEKDTEQGEGRTPYSKETVEVIAGMLRETQSDHLRKVLADGLRYARGVPRGPGLSGLQGADLQGCDLRNSYLGVRKGDKERLDLSTADLYGADCSGASLRGVIAIEAVFYQAVLERTVLVDANVEGADFRAANLTGAKFAGARIGGAKFEGAEGIPDEVANLLDSRSEGRIGAVVALAEGTS